MISTQRILRASQCVYLAWKDVVEVGGMMEDSQLFNLAIPAPVLDGRPFFGGDVDPPRKYCTHGLKVPL